MEKREEKYISQDKWTHLEETALNYVVDRYEDNHSEPSLSVQQGFIDGYTTRNDEVVKMVQELDGDDGKSGDYYAGYFACKNELLTKLKEDKK